MSAKTKVLIEKAIACNGIFAPFSQSEDGIKALRDTKDDPASGKQVLHNDKKHKDTQDGLYIGGMCHTLSLMYLACLTGHKDVSKGEGLINWIKPASGGYNDGAINYIVAKTVMYKTQDVKSGIIKIDEAEFDREFLEKYGLKPNGAEAKGNEKAIQDYLILAATKGKQFHMLALSGKDSGHALSATTQHKPFLIRFFDSNHGEFLFTKESDFAQWFPDYWKESGASAKYTSKKIRSYSL